MFYMEINNGFYTWSKTRIKLNVSTNSQSQLQADYATGSYCLWFMAVFGLLVYRMFTTVILYYMNKHYKGISEIVR